MILLKKAHEIKVLRIRVKTLQIDLEAERTRKRIAAALKRQAERIYR